MRIGRLFDEREETALDFARDDRLGARKESSTARKWRTYSIGVWRNTGQLTTDRGNCWPLPTSC